MQHPFRSKPDGGRVFRSGLYSAAILAAATALTVLVNLVVRALPVQYTTFDLSAGGLYTLGDTSRAVAAGLDRDVVIYYLCETGQEDAIITGTLDQYAAASGMTRQQYIGKLEAAQRQQELAAEVEKCRGEFPEGTPDAALTEIAKNRIASRQAAERQQAMQRQSELQQMQQRAQQAVNQARQQEARRGWDAFEQLTGIHEAKDVPARVLELVRTGASPVAAWWQHQSEQKDTQLQIKAQNQKNKAASAGSMAGGADPSGFEAEFMNAFKF